MGQEPYTLLMLLRDRLDIDRFNRINVLATDIDESNLFNKIISLGVYEYEFLGRIPSNYFDRFFIENDNEEFGPKKRFRIIDEIKNRIEYQRHDLTSLSISNKKFDVIICKNVLLHFHEKTRNDVIRFFYECLNENGHLVLEQTQKLPGEVSELFRLEYNNGQIFKKI